MFHSRWTTLLALWWLVGPSLVGAAPVKEPEPPVSFRRDVMAILAKSGCASGACHGNRAGKGGFKLSLRGEDPDADFVTLTTGLSGRRLNFSDPDQSLLLLKPTTEVTHEGGARFAKDSPEYRVLQRWIAARAPDDQDRPKLNRLAVSPSEQFIYAPKDKLQVKVTATFADGEQRDVTALAVYEASNVGVAKVSPNGLVTRQQPGESTIMVRYLDQQAPVSVAFVPRHPEFRSRGFPKSTNAVDAAVFAKLKQLRLNPADLCSDNDYVRRAYLDLLGILPTADEARTFVADRAKDKRATLVELLLARPEFSEFWALKWADLLRLDERTLDEKGARLFYEWLRSSLSAGKPLDQLARELIATRGSTYASPAANYYRNLRTPVERAEAVAQVWLGTRLQCAQCHNHPYERWTQNNYHDWTAVFARVDYQVLENRRRDDNDSHEFKGEQVVFVKNSGEHKHPRTGKPAVPHFLGVREPVGEQITMAALGIPESPINWPTNAISGSTELDALAVWLTSPQHPLFARVQANRIWFHLMGRGLVDPIDDFRLTNPPSHPALLDALTAELVRSGFDLRSVIRLVMNSRVYQASSVPAKGSEEDSINYSHTVVRRLTAEQLLDAQSQASGVPLEFSGFPVGIRAGQMPLLKPGGRRGRDPLDQFLVTFGKPQRQVPSECERATEPAMTQAFAFISGPTLQEFIGDKDNRLTALLASGMSAREMLDELYWSSLTRAPSPVEASRLIPLIESAPDRRAVLEDILWSLLNAKEFVLRR
ncbi:MAG TPA: DUF1549 and DUF1553 domain-containing protein [Verrucomicrobiota bacterium]|nr:DUF1549 and DUF1553 domain-containing protein [Verrucomicrobiota bacterium]